MENKKWYNKPTGSEQAIIIEEQTGKTVAVCYQDGEQANLIASAPELIEALTDVLRILNLEPTYDNLYQRNKIEALINKAKGNTSC